MLDKKISFDFYISFDLGYFNFHLTVIKMGGKKNSKEDVNVSSAESVNSGSDGSSGDEEGEDYVVERVVDKQVSKNGKVSGSLGFWSFLLWILKSLCLILKIEKKIISIQIPFV